MLQKRESFIKDTTGAGNGIWIREILCTLFMALLSSCICSIDRVLSTLEMDYEQIKITRGLKKNLEN